ncbi:ABC-2 transporter permease [Haloimpatiens sp. FM7330]|uniref:ABC-2 transporter permease n=1 Tax=Haloimpatiens sp. FM7330 TaxID=3298610 RepID=UPI003632D51C
MISLIMKDLRCTLIKWNICFYIFYVFFITFTMGDTNPKGTYLIIIFTLAYFTPIMSFVYDEKYKTDTIINSLPVTRHQVVISKYLSICISIILSVIFSALVLLITNTLGISSIDVIQIDMIKKMIIITFLMSSLIFPLCFKFGYRKAKFFFIFLYVALVSSLYNIFSPNNTDGLSTKIITYINALTSNQIILALIVSSIVIISVVISMTLYDAKDISS